jgi:hypothetical protein
VVRNFPLNSNELLTGFFSLKSISSSSSGYLFFRCVNNLISVRYCQIKTTPRVEKKGLLEPDRRTVTLSGSECSGLAEMSSGFYRRGQAVGMGESL